MQTGKKLELDHKQLITLKSSIKEIQKKNLKIAPIDENFQILKTCNDKLYLIDLSPFGSGGAGNVYYAYPMDKKDKSMLISQKPQVFKKVSEENLISKEVEGLTKLYDNIDYVLIGEMNGFIFPYFPGKPLIPDQELSVDKLNITFKELPFVQRIQANYQIAKGIYQIHTPDNKGPYLHGDIKGSNFHLWIHSSGKVQIFLFDFGASEKVVIQNGKPQPVLLDRFVGSLGHITKTMIPDGKLIEKDGEKDLTTFLKTLEDDIHNCVPLMGCLLGADNPYYDKITAVYQASFLRKVMEYQLIIDPSTMSAREQIRIGKNEEGYYAYCPLLVGKKIFHDFKLNEEIIKKLDNKEKLSSEEEKSIIKQVLELDNPFSVSKLKLLTEDYRAEQGVSYNLKNMYEGDIYTNWQSTRPYVEAFLKKMEGHEIKHSANALEARFFWGAMQYFCEKNEKKVEHLSEVITHWKSTFDLLISDTLQTDHSFPIQKFKKFAEKYFSQAEGTPLFWETVNDFFKTYQKSPDLSLPILSKLALLSRKQEEIVAEYAKDFDLAIPYNLPQAIIILSEHAQGEAFDIALVMLVSSSHLIKQAIVELCFLPLEELKSVLPSALKKLASSEKEIFAHDIIEKKCDLRMVSLKEFDELYKNILTSQEYNPTFWSSLSKNQDESKGFIPQEKRKLEELRTHILSASDDLTRFQLLKEYSKSAIRSQITVFVETRKNNFPETLPLKMFL